MSERNGRTFTRRDVLRAGAAVGGALAVPGGLRAQAPQKLQPWTHLLGAAVDVGASYLWVGKELGYFAEEGIDLQIQPSAGSSQALQVLIAERVDSNSPAPDALIAAAARGQPVPVKAVHLYVPKLHLIPAVRADSPIAKPTDLKGKTVGVFSNAHAGVNYIKQYVAESGLDPEKDLTLLPVGQGLQAAEALTSAKVDALALWDTTYRAMEDNGYKLKTLPQSRLGNEMFAIVLVVHENTLKSRPSQTAGWLRAVNKTIVFAIENPEAASRIHYRMFPETKPKGKPDDVIFREGANALRARAPQLVPRNERMRGEFDAAGWRAWIKFMGVDDKLKDPAPFYTNELIASANQFDLDAVKRFARAYKA
jgi:NitT/TauT family transport system substrate-binding protein